MKLEAREQVGRKSIARRDAVRYIRDEPSTACGVHCINAYEIDWRVAVLERRRARRFKVGWDVTVTATDGGGSIFGETAKLENLSSSGAFLFLTRSLDPGTRAEVWIRVPFKRENWMKYFGEVVRSESMPARVGIAVRFDTARPIFEVK